MSLTGNPSPSAAPVQVEVYDTTLRDGAQQEGLNLTGKDKIAITQILDDMGVTFIEGGWPGANPKDTKFFAEIQKTPLKNATLVAFGSTRRARVAAAEDLQVQALLASGAPVITLVAKFHAGHVRKALRTTAPENLAMITDTVSYLRSQGRRVIVDAEHYFDGYLLDKEYALAAVQAAADAGAETIVLCDTNGGMLPHQVSEIVAATGAVTSAKIGIHCHNDTGCAVANSIAAVQAGAEQVQGTINGYGERTGNANLCTVVANLSLKLGITTLTAEQLQEMSRLAHAIGEITAIAPAPRAPYIGWSAFAHKAGLHASALKVDADLYQHIDPRVVGNEMRTLVSDMAGRASIELKGRELGFDLADQPELLARVVARVKALEQEGITFDAADASFELLLREELTGRRDSFFEIESWRVISETAPDGSTNSEATVKLHAGGSRHVAVGEGNGPVNALDYALRAACAATYPELASFELSDYRVRILDSSRGTHAITRVLIDTASGREQWSTVGVGPNVVNASWQALVESFTYGLIRLGLTPR